MSDASEFPPASEVSTNIDFLNASYRTFADTATKSLDVFGRRCGDPICEGGRTKAASREGKKGYDIRAEVPRTIKVRKRPCCGQPSAIMATTTL